MEQHQKNPALMSMPLDDEEPYPSQVEEPDVEDSDAEMEEHSPEVARSKYFLFFITFTFMLCF